MEKRKDNSIPQICFIAPTESLAGRASTIIRRKSLKINVYTVALEGAVGVARELIQQGTWLFISRGGTKRILEKELSATVVDIPLLASDYIPALEQAAKAKGKIAFFLAEEVSDELRTMCYLQALDAQYYYFTDDESCRQCVMQSVWDGAVLGVGGIVSGRYAKEAGMPYIVVESSNGSIERAVETAEQLYQVHRASEKERELLEIQLERYKNILNYTHDAIIAIDGSGHIEVTNQVAEKILNKGKFPLEGRRIEEVLPNTQMIKILRTGEAETGQLMNINGTMFSTNRVPIIVNHKVKGAVATFRDIKSLQSTERQIRIKLHEKGLTAKYYFSDIIGNSQIMLNAKSLARDFADSHFTIMLYGETGTGKELFAQSIHNASPRKDGPFVAVNCTALSKSLLEAELFGYEDGSFTGAKRGGKAGLFEIAHGGTIFLDEIGELPLEFQAQFLRVIQEKEVRRVGGDSVIPVDIRVIGATNRNLLSFVESGEFRKDLYYRLNVLNLMIPALSMRGDDYLQIAESIYEKSGAGLTEGDWDSFLNIMRTYSGYQWPGNVRELHNIVERICLLQKKGLTQEKIIATLQTAFIAEPVNPSAGQQTKSLEDLERQEILNALEKNHGSVAKAAKDLKISRSTLYRKLKENQ
ncbi:sigma 54-interacting transcriptional regulator [Lacrimispora sp.]|uniref:sigma 54-interacting transcriptional regulator n=1 Tax=Lacrimispora sp. TaxID=2719234 RepID=UPI0039954A1F